MKSTYLIFFLLYINSLGASDNISGIIKVKIPRNGIFYLTESSKYQKQLSADVLNCAVGGFTNGNKWDIYIKPNSFVPGIYIFTWRTKKGDKFDWIAFSKEDIAHGFVLVPYEYYGTWRIKKIQNI